MLILFFTRPCFVQSMYCTHTIPLLSSLESSTQTCFDERNRLMSWHFLQYFPNFVYITYLSTHTVNNLRSLRATYRTDSGRRLLLLNWRRRVFRQRHCFSIKKNIFKTNNVHLAFFIWKSYDIVFMTIGYFAVVLITYS